MPPKRHAPPNRTNQLPASLRQELEELGKLAPKSSKPTRREKRKAKRNDGKAARAEHFASKKRKEAPVDDVSAGSDEPRKTKKVKKELPSEVPKKHQTPLEKLLAKQEGGLPIEKVGKRSKTETDEDREIAWLEAKLGVKEKGKWKEEVADDGLDDLFDDLDDIEAGAFGMVEKDYAKLIKTQGLLSDGEQDSSEEDDEDGASQESDEDEEVAEYGLEDEELFNPSDDDDHKEMGEISFASDDEEPEEELLDDDDASSDGVDAGELSDAEPAWGTQQTTSEDKEEAEWTPIGDVSLSVLPDPVASTSRYVPPHLRQKAVERPTPTAPSSKASANLPIAPPEDPRLRRQILGHLNKLSPSNLPVILSALEGVYGSHPRALMNAQLVSVLLDIVASKDDVGHQLLVTYAALVAALSRIVGIEFPAAVVAKCVAVFDESRAKGKDHEDGGFEGRPGSKECENVVGFLAELYNFSVVACVIVYDLIRMFIEGGLGELEVELLVKVVKRSGQQLRQDDPSALKDIISLVKQKLQGIEPSSMNSRTKFMLESLTNLRNNKIKPTGDGAVDHYSGLKKFLSGLKKRGGSTPDPLRLTLADIRSSTSKGKWWIVGAAWGGDPLVDQPLQHLSKSNDASSDAALAKLAKAHGMNTEIRKGIFIVLMSSEDYVDACDRLIQLGLTDVQQREIARVLLQCSGNEKAYNPYYTLVASQMGLKSHSFQITLQYCLWDFFRELGEKSVGGAEMVKNLGDDARGSTNVSPRRVANVAKLYAWCVAKEVLSLAILKPVPFGKAKPQTTAFLQQFFQALILSTQMLSPALILTSAGTRRDREALERVLVKAAPFGSLVKGLLGFFETVMEDLDGVRGQKELALLKWGVKVAEETLGLGGSIVSL